MPDEKVVREAVRQVVYDMAHLQAGDDDPLISSGLIDSLSILKLISRLEARLSIQLPTDNLQPDDFESVNWIVDTVQRHSK